MFENVLLIGRENCFYSQKLYLFLKKKSKKLYHLKSKSLGEKLKLNNTIKNKKFDYIISFRSFYILKKNLLNKCKYAAINFHAGTPEYRGIGSINFSIYENFPYCGSTCHLISKELDKGSIIDVVRFKYSKNLELDLIVKKIHKVTFLQAKKIINLLYKNSNNLEKLIAKNKKYKWSKKIYTVKQLRDLYSIDKNIKEKKFNRIIQATNSNSFKPYIILHKKKFELKD